MLVGIITLLSQHKRKAILTFLIAASTTLPSILNTNSQTYALRSIALIPWITILAAVGVYTIIHKTNEMYRNKIAADFIKSSPNIFPWVVEMMEEV